MNFPIKDIKSYEKKSPPLSEPTEIAYFSLDEDRQFRNDASGLRTFSPVNLENKINLFEGYEKFQMRKEDVSEHLDHLLKALLVNSSAVQGRCIPKFVTWRGVMTKLICTPYADKENYVLNVSKYDNVIYIEEHLTEEVLHNIETRTQRDLRYMFSGYKFEHVCTSSSVDVINNSECFCSVIYTKFGNHDIVMGAEIDAQKLTLSESVKEYVEFKTSTHIEHRHQQVNFEKHKLLKFWAQSFLAGVPRIHCGFRNVRGDLISVTEFETLKIPRIVRGKAHGWDPNVCLNFFNDFLDFLAANTENESTYRVTFACLPSPNFTMCLLSDYVFLPTWYKEAHLFNQ